jgi:hypothetical protein
MGDPREKYCPQCGAAHQAWATRCADCDCDLVAEPPSPEIAPASELPPARELACLGTGDAWHVRDVAEALQEAGLSCRIDSHPPDAPLAGPGFSARRGFSGETTKLGVYVLPDQLERARRVEHAHRLSRIPGASETAAAPHDEEACPACGVPLAPAAAECAECGLEFPAADE